MPHREGVLRVLLLGCRPRSTRSSLAHLCDSPYPQEWLCHNIQQWVLVHWCLPAPPLLTSCPWATRAGFTPPPPRHLRCPGDVIGCKRTPGPGDCQMTLVPWQGSWCCVGLSEPGPSQAGDLEVTQSLNLQLARARGSGFVTWSHCPLWLPPGGGLPWSAHSVWGCSCPRKQ